MPLRVRQISRDEHLALIAARPSASFLQTPAWGEVKAPGWRPHSIGWVDDTGAVVGAGLVLLRPLPRLKRYLAYLPEGPALPWESIDLAQPAALAAWLDPMVAHLRSLGAFTIKMGPQVVTRRWRADTVKAALAAAAEAAAPDASPPPGAPARLAGLPPDTTVEQGTLLTDGLRAAGWRRREAEGAGFGDFQPRYVFQVPLEGRSLDDVRAGFNQLWRRNIKKAEKGGVTVELGGASDLPAFHEVYRVTATRDGFTGRPLAYFEKMWAALSAEAPDRIRLYLARASGGTVLAATLVVRVGGHVWYSYGASADTGRELRPSNAAQWRMIADAVEGGAAVYDLRGISDTLDPGDHLFGLLQFKLGTGGEAVEYVGEWDLPVNRVLHAAFELYLRRR